MGDHSGEPKALADFVCVFEIMSSVLAVLLCVIVSLCSSAFGIPSWSDKSSTQSCLKTNYKALGPRSAAPRPPKGPSVAEAN